MLRWTLGYMCLFQFWFPRCVCPAVGLLGHKVVLFAPVFLILLIDKSILSPLKREWFLYHLLKFSILNLLLDFLFCLTGLSINLCYIALIVLRFLISLFYFFKFTYFNWRLISLQYCSGFCHTLTWISYGCTCVPHPDPHASNLDWWSSLHMIIYMFQCYSLKSSHPCILP